jgi:hypothetical protein
LRQNAKVSDQRQQVRIFGRGSRLLGVSLLLILLAATLGGTFDPTSADDQPALVPGVFFIAAEVASCFERSASESQLARKN